MKFHRLPILFAVLAISLFAAGSAEAETTTLGNPLTEPIGLHGVCGNTGGCASALLSMADGKTVVPGPGHVLRWRVLGTSNGAAYELSAVKRLSGSTFSVTATTVPEISEGNELETFTSSIPVQTGEYLALNVEEGADIWFTEGASSEAFFSPPLSAGETREGEVESFPAEMGVNADVEYSPLPLPTPAPPPPPAPPAQCKVPNVAGLKLKAAKKKLRKAHCKPGTLIVPVGPNGKAATNKLRVKKTKPKAGAVRPAGTAVKIVLGRP